MTQQHAPHRILYAQYTNPAGYPPLEHSSHILANAGWQVLFLGTVAPADPMRFAPHPRITTRYLSFQKPGWRQKLHFIFFCVWVLYWALRFRSHWVYASELLSAPAAWLAHFVPGTKLIYHEHDTPAPPRNAWTRLQFATRRAVAKRAQVCVIPNQERARLFADSLGVNNVQCVWNCPARDEIAPLANKTSDEMWMYYHGSLVPARLPLIIIDALAQLPQEIKLRIVGYETVGHPEYSAELVARANALGVQDRVQIHAAVPRAELFDVCRPNHIGLAFMPLSCADANEQNMVGASNKPFDYLACGLTLLLADLPAWRALYAEYAQFCNPTDAASIAAAARWFWEHPAERALMAERGYARVRTEWNYETQFAPVLKQLTQNQSRV